MTVRPVTQPRNFIISDIPAIPAAVKYAAGAFAPRAALHTNPRRRELYILRRLLPS